MAHDIFVSYAHADDDVPGNAPYGVVTTFVEELKKLLRMKMGGTGADVWMDHLLAANERVTETLAEHVRDSRTILLFMSPGYLKSSWCAMELQQFLQDNQASFHRENVFVVALDETDRAGWPSRVQALTPIDLFEKDIQSITRRLGWPYLPTDPDSKYWSRMNELAHLINGQLKRTNPPGGPVPGVPAPGVANPGKAAAKRPTVWIAQGTVDVCDEWESLASAIRQTGAQVVPRGVNTYPLADGSAFKRVVTEDLLGADLLVQLLGADAGPPLAGTESERIALLQNQMAQALRGNIYPQLMRWRKRAVPDATAAQEPFEQLLLGAVAGSFEQFRSLVLEAVQSLMLPRPVAKPVANAAADTLTVCVTGAVADRDLAHDVCNVVNDLGAVTYPVEPKPSDGQSQTEYREQFEDLLGSVDGVILVYGKAPAMWLHSRHAQVRKVLAQRKLAVWGAFLDGPPQNKPDAVECKGPGLLTLSCREGLEQQPIAQFLQQLRLGDGHV